MEWEIMYLCNLLGVTLLIAIAFMHILGVPPEKNAEYITFGQKKNE